MATQASAITFMSTPGQGYESGLGFVQNYFGMPLALIIVAAVFLPIYRRLNVYTAYEFLGRRFDAKTRLLGAALFLLQRGLAAGITIYAPAIVLSTVFGWRLDVTIVLQRAAGDRLHRGGRQPGGDAHPEIPAGADLRRHGDGVHRAAGAAARRALADRCLHGGRRVQKLEAVDFSLDLHQRYTFWSGLLGGLFLSLSYFGTDQSQVQRYLHGASLRESRLGLMFNAVCKIPMQFFILLLGALVFVFYQFEQPPVFFNQVAWKARRRTRPRRPAARARGGLCRGPRREASSSIHAWLGGRSSAGDPQAAAARRRRRGRAAAQRGHPRRDAGACCTPQIRGRSANDADYVFITFMLDHLPHGVIGLLVAVFFAAALSSKASELNALGATTTIDFYRHVVRREADDAHYVTASKWFTALWGLVALAFALFAHLVENLIQAVNILGSDFLRRGARPLPGGVFPPARRRHRGVLGGGRGADPGVSDSISRSTSATSGIMSSAAPPAW